MKRFAVTRNMPSPTLVNETAPSASVTALAAGSVPLTSMYPASVFAMSRNVCGSALSTSQFTGYFSVSAKSPIGS